jgi:ribonuclease HIII
MTASIEFCRPVDSALSELERFCKEHGVSITKLEDVNKGAGIKLHGTIDNLPVAILLYFNRKKGVSTRIVLEKMPDGMREVFVKHLSPPRTSRAKAIPIHASITIADKNARQSIRADLGTASFALTECPKQEHIDYAVKLVSNGNDLTVTQFSSGSLLLQGGYSNLVDRVVEIIDKIKPLSTVERALLYVPEVSKEIVSENINKEENAFEKALEAAESTADDYFRFLFTNDQQSFGTGELLVDILENQDKTLPEYNFLVAIYAKVFEGFLTKLLIAKDFFTFDQYASDPEIADIGNALRKKKLEKYIKDKKRYGFIIEELISVWEGSRCKEMHSDPVAEQGIISVPTLKDAKDRIGAIKTCLKNAYNILVKHGFTDQDLAGKASSQPVTTSNTPAATLKENGYIGTDESGKGDYFGPLVVAGVFLDPVTEKRLADAGIRDSKTISDNRIHEFATMITSYLDKSQYSIVAVGPEKYNELYSKMGNLNRLLAWGHARSIENILLEVDCKSAISDQFGDESYIQKALLEKGKTIELLQMPKAEQHTAVAAASVLARATFLRGLTQLQREFGMEFPKGASAEVELAAKRFIKKYGFDQLRKCAKIHFKITDRLKRS